jgi:cell division protein FtsQ
MNPRIRLVLFGLAAVLALGSPFWGPLVMRRMPFFHVHRIEILGAHYVSSADVVARLNVDTMKSVWDPTAPLEARVESFPEVAKAVIERKLPGALVVHVTERIPVAFVQSSGGMRAYDERGALLPIDPARVTVDLPVLWQRDTVLLRLLGAMRIEMPGLYSRLTFARRGAGNDVIFLLDTERVRVMRDVTLDRLADIAPVEDDLAKKHLRVAEIDLRYRDQVIARLP